MSDGATEQQEASTHDANVAHHTGSIFVALVSYLLNQRSTVRILLLHQIMTVDPRDRGVVKSLTVHSPFVTAPEKG